MVASTRWTLGSKRYGLLSENQNNDILKKNLNQKFFAPEKYLVVINFQKIDYVKMILKILFLSELFSAST